jgi:16S rRNA (cytidine1402-2'-O)-methyltransferase
MTGTLFVVPTPLGNLEDITLRAIRVLKEVGTIAAEDTRHSRPLLAHFGISTRLISYHQHTKHSGLTLVLKSLESEDVALISDAGMPSLADPGYELIRATIQHGHRVEVLPGASAVTTAVALAALPARGFTFMGFLPRGRSEMRGRLQEVADLPYSLVIFEAPNRVAGTLSIIADVLGNRPTAALRELTKIHEDAIRGRVTDILEAVRARDPRGEWTLVVGPSEDPRIRPADAEIEAALSKLRNEGATGRDAVEIVAEAFDVPKSEVYRLWLKE